MNEKDIYKYTEIIYQGKSYRNDEIRNNSVIKGKLNKSMLYYPSSFLEKVKKENGVIRLEFNENNRITVSLINVSQELLDEFQSVYY